MRPFELRKDLLRICAAASLCALLAMLVVAVGTADAGKVDALEARLSHARDEAGGLSARLQSTTAELAAAEAEAAQAKAHEERLSGMLEEGRERVAELTRELRTTRHRLEVEKARLQRARRVLADRLVAIYESGTPDTADLVLESSDYQDFVARNDYLRAISEADSSLAERVAEVRAAVRREVQRVGDLKAEAVEYDERLESARAEIAAARTAAEAAAARLQSLSASREASLATLKSDIAEWVDEVQEIRAAEARAASEAAAEEEVGRWLGGPYAIPTYIVMCESGGNYSALNPSSGAGGAYQILPSTWELYGGEGEPQNAPKAEQDRIAGEIWADSGPSAWVCG
ncbi:MAG TPA: transglycosylase family protein [Solirubrobacterales bacterium]|nr:transglycosylase family protein [Solirubrobacterales bacterium]